MYKVKVAVTVIGTRGEVHVRVTEQNRAISASRGRWVQN